MMRLDCLVIVGDSAVVLALVPVGDAAVSVSGTGSGNAQLEILIPGGTNHDLWTSGNLSARIVQPAIDTDFELELKFDSAAIERFEMQGILVEESANRYLRLDFQGQGSTTNILAAALENNVGTVLSNIPIPAGTPMYMRVKRAGDVWTRS